MKKNILDKKFIHHSWFKEGVTRKYALDHFAKNQDFYLTQKPSKKQSDGLFDDILYDDVITDRHSNYRLCDEEKCYYLERKEYWDNQRKLEVEKWLNTEIDFDKEIKNYLCGYIHYDIKGAKEQLNQWKNQPDAEYQNDTIQYWERQVKERTRKHNVIDRIIEESQNCVKTNKDFIELQKRIKDAIGI